MKKILLQCVSSNKIYIFLKRSKPFQGYLVILYDSETALALPVNVCLFRSCAARENEKNDRGL